MKDASGLPANLGGHVWDQTYLPCPGYAPAKLSDFLLKVQAQQDYAALFYHSVACSFKVYFCQSLSPEVLELS